MNKQLLTAYYNNQCTQSEKIEIEQWLASHEQTPEIDDLLLDLLNNTTVTYDTKTVEDAFVSFENNRKKQKRYYLKSKLRKFNHWVQKIAAVMVIPVLMTTYYFYEKASSPIIWQEAYAPLGETRLIKLPDNSKIWINSGSKLIYPKEFTYPFRQVYIIGEAYAEIQKNTSHPFIMSAGNVNVRVLGTKFNVRSYTEDSEIEVSLIEGAVCMSTDYNKQKIILSPGDVIKFNKKNGTFSQYTIDVTSYSHWFKDSNFYFIDQTLEQIVTRLERHYKVDIIIEKESIKQYKYYAVFINNENLKQILSALSAQLNIRVNFKNNVIYITE